MNYFRMTESEINEINKLILNKLSEMIPITVRGADGKFLCVSEQFLKHLRLNPSDVEGKGSTDLIKEKYYNSSASEKAFRIGEDSKELFHAIDDQWVYSHSKVVKDENNKVKTVVTYCMVADELMEDVDKLRHNMTYLQKSNEYLYDYLLRKHNTPVFEDELMKRIVKNTMKIAASDASVVITGESGVGKEIIAKLLHENSPRKEKPFVPVCIPQMSPSLMESELFGYEKGAFTSASNSGHIGLLESAEGGTVFLDEIGDIPMDLQVKLLRVLESRKFTRVGGVKTIELNVRFIAATNKDLKKMVRENLFREDLLYRIGVIFIDIPPLRERKEDIIPLAKHYIAILNNLYNKYVQLSKDTYKYFENYSWPGNVRELRNIIEKIVVLTERSLITPVLLENLLIGEDMIMADVRRRESPDNSFDERAVIDEYKHIEREKILEALVETNGNRKAAAEKLGISRTTLYRKLLKTEDSEDLLIHK